MSGDSGKQIHVRPLTKRKADGELYQRRDEVEQQLHEVLRLSPNELANRILVPNTKDSGHLFDETLVYLLREARRRKDDTIEDLIYTQLAVRVEILLRKHARQVDPDDHDDFRQELHKRIIRKIFDLSSDKADYAEVMFGNFVTSEAATLKRKHWRLENRERANVEIDAPNEEGHDYDPPAEGLSPEQIVILGNALDKLPERTKTAYSLRYCDGLLIESNDPNEETVSSVLRVTGRTVRLWFEKAESMLTADEGGER